MRVFLTLVVGILGIIIGAFLLALIGYWLTGLGGMSDFEGGRSMFIVFFIGPTGAFLGFFVGCFGGWKLGKPPMSPNRILTVLGLCVGALVVVCVVAGMG